MNVGQCNTLTKQPPCVLHWTLVLECKSSPDPTGIPTMTNQVGRLMRQRDGRHNRDGKKQGEKKGDAPMTHSTRLSSKRQPFSIVAPRSTPRRAERKRTYSQLQDVRQTSLVNPPSLNETGWINPVQNPSPLSVAKNGNDGESVNVDGTTPCITKKKPSDARKRRFFEDGMQSKKVF